MSFTNQSKNEGQFHSEIDVKIADFILTPLSCAALINEILKSLLYQKSQIPYPYVWLKNIMDKKRKSTEQTTHKNFVLINHFKTVSSAYDGLETIMENILSEFRLSNGQIKEIVVLFGSTPVCPKEVFTIRIPNLEFNHTEQNHSLNTSSKLQRILRNIFLSDSWMGSLDNSLTCTNTYVYLKKHGSSFSNGNDSKIFLPSKPLSLSSKVRHILINLNYVNTNACGSNSFEIFSDISTNDKDNETNDKVEKRNDNNSTNSFENDEIVWVQSKILVQGFKDCFINKVPACELW